MERKSDGKIEIDIFDAREMAGYIDKIFSNKGVRDLIISAKSIQAGKECYTVLGEFLTNYATATGDFSSEGIESVVSSIKQSRYILEEKQQYKAGVVEENPKVRLFKASVLPMIVEHWRKKLGKDENLSLNDMAEIANALTFQCSNNKFRTHSFNGALLENVEKNGLDIRREMFREEYQTLSKISKSPYKTGELMFCELSAVSFGYATRSPERLWMTINKHDLKQKDDETIREFARRNVESIMQNEEDNLTEDEVRKVAEDANKIINFYYVDSKCCISLIKQKVDVPYRDSNGPAISNLINLPSRVTFNLSEEDRARCKACRLLPNAERLDKFDELLPDLKERYPKLRAEIEKVETAACQEILLRYGLNNFMYEGYSDGYKVESGRVAFDDLAIATFENPIDMYATNQKRIQAEEESEG